MAHLDVRERRLEAKIAYVGAPLSGKATNLERLGRAEHTDGLLSIEWKPPAETTFRDCEVRVRLVTAKGDVSPERVGALVRDADAVVFVADADPDAVERNRAAVAVFKSALAAESARSVPVVVQLNKTDLPDALDPAAATDALEIGAWPVVIACASRGDGVLETAERALEGALEGLRDREPESRATVRPQATVTHARDGHPLLSALRQVLRETVATHVDELEGRLASRIENVLEGAARASERTIVDAFRRTADEQARQRITLDALDAEVVSMKARLDGAFSELLTRLDAAERATSSFHAEASNQLGDVVAEILAQRESISEVTSAFRTSSTDIARTVDGWARADGQVSASLAAFKKSLDAMAESRPAELKAVMAALRSSHDELSERVGSLITQTEPTTAAVARITPELRNLEKALLQELKAESGAVLRQVRSLSERTTEAAASADDGLTNLKASLTTLIEEMNKPKKGWFG